MKKLLALSLFLSFSAVAACPKFERLYNNCHSSGDAVEFITIKAQEPYYKFTFHNQNDNYRMYVVTDGELRDVTIQTQDGSEANYSEVSSCIDGRLSVVRTDEVTAISKETVFESSYGQLIVTNSTNGVINNQTTCSIPSFL